MILDVVISLLLVLLDEGEVLLDVLLAAQEDGRALVEGLGGVVHHLHLAWNGKDSLKIGDTS